MTVSSVILNLLERWVSCARNIQRKEKFIYLFFTFLEPDDRTDYFMLIHKVPRKQIDLQET